MGEFFEVLWVVFPCFAVWSEKLKHIQYSAYMPKKKSATKTKSAWKKDIHTLNFARKFFAHHKVIGLLLIIIGAWALIWLGQAAIERYNFYRVEKTMDSINKQINSNFKVLSETKDRSCGTRDEAFGESLGGCSVSYSYKISVSNNAKQTAEKIDKLIRGRGDVEVSNPDPALFKNTNFVLINKINSGSPDVYSSSYNFSGVSNPTCEIIYSLPGSSEVEKNTKVNIICFLSGRSAKFPYFPVQN